jgi:hypothetical protein
MGAPRLALLVAPVLLAGCADLVTPMAHSSRAEPVTVRITVAPRDVHGAVSLHDEIRYVRITGTGSDTVRELEPDGEMQVRLPAPGPYEVTSWTRSCAQTCATLHPARHRCSASFTAATETTTRVEIRFPIGRACAISVAPRT